MNENRTQTTMTGEAMEPTCATCRKRPPAQGRKSCQECLDTMSGLQQQRREQRRANSECQDCGSPLTADEIERGLARCSSHRKAAYGRVRNAREHKKELEQRHGID